MNNHHILFCLIYHRYNPFSVLDYHYLNMYLHYLHIIFQSPQRSSSNHLHHFRLSVLYHLSRSQLHLLLQNSTIFHLSLSSQVPCTLSGFSCSFHPLTSFRMDFFAFSLIAGRKFVKNFPYLFFVCLERNVYPRKSNDVFS